MSSSDHLPLSKRLRRDQMVTGSTSNDPEGSNSNARDDTRLMGPKRIIGKCFYENGIDFDVVKSPSFRSMIALDSRNHVEIPTTEELKGWILEDFVKEMQQYENEIKLSWVQTGCSILLDGWTSVEGHHILNILVHCPKGTIYLRTCDIYDLLENMDAVTSFFGNLIEELGVDNVVQIITNSTEPLMKEIGDRVMDEYSIFWTVDTSCCMELMIEKYGAMVSETLDHAKTITRFIHSHPGLLHCLHEGTSTGEELVVRSKTRLAFSFFTLENIVNKEKTLRSLFSSTGLRTSLDDQGKSVVDLVLNNSFWTKAKTVVNAVIPLVHASEWFRNNNSHMGCTYEMMDQVKEAIKASFNKTSSYKTYWKTIDEVWNDHLFSNVHAAGYYLNPKFFYADDVRLDEEVCTGLFSCISLTCENHHILRRVYKQLKQYKNATGSFNDGSQAANRLNMSPVDWWSKYGEGYPDLRRIAIRILSQTCLGASQFKLKRSMAETLIQRRRNSIEQEKLTKVAYVHYNMQLKNFVSGLSDSMNSTEMSELVHDWIGGAHM